MPEELNGGGTPNPGEQNSNREVAPEWARDAISKANNEAAKYRTERNDYRDQLTAALAEVEKYKGEVSTAAADKAKAETELVKLGVALAAGIPGDKAAAFAARLQGATEEELKADAESLKGVFPTEVTPSATDPSQGRGANTPRTPETAFAEMLRGQLEPIINR